MEYAKFKKFDLWQFIFVWIVSFLFTYTDILGISEAENRISQDTFYEVTAYQLPKDKQPKIAVVLATDDDLKFMQTTWPLDHYIHADFIEELASHKPESIFIDFLFLDIRNKDASDQLVKSLINVNQTTQIFLASPFLENGRYMSDASKVFYDELVKGEVKLVDITYKALEGLTVVMPGDNLNHSPAAIAMYDRHCSIKQNSCAILDKQRLEKTELFWRGEPAECEQQNSPNKCNSLSKNWLSRLLDKVKISIFPTLASTTLTQQSLYPYPTRSIEAIYTGEGQENLLFGASVFYGSYFFAVQDVTKSPVYGDIAGVFSHATLFDNLVVWGDNKFSSERPFKLGTRLYEFIFIGLLSFVLVSAQLIKGTQGNNHSLINWPILSVIIFGAMISLFEAYVLRTTPEHWLLSFHIIIVWLVPLEMIIRYVKNKYLGFSNFIKH